MTVDTRIERGESVIDYAFSDASKGRGYVRWAPALDRLCDAAGSPMLDAFWSPRRRPPTTRRNAERLAHASRVIGASFITGRRSRRKSFASRHRRTDQSAHHHAAAEKSACHARRSFGAPRRPPGRAARQRALRPRRRADSHDQPDPRRRRGGTARAADPADGMSQHPGGGDGGYALARSGPTPLLRRVALRAGRGAGILREHHSRRGWSVAADLETPVE